MCVIIFSINLYEAFLILRRNEQDMIKNVYWSSLSTLSSCPIVMKLQFSLQVFEKHSNIKLNENPLRGRRSMRTERLAEGQAGRQI